MMTRHSNEGNNRDDMNISSGQMRTLGEQQAHRAVMEAKRALVDSDNSVLLIGKEVGDMSGQLFE